MTCVVSKRSYRTCSPIRTHVSPTSPRKAQRPQQISDSLSEVKPPRVRIFMRAGLAGGAVDFDTAGFHHLFGAKDVIAVAYQNAGFETHALENLAGGFDRVCGSF